MPQDEGKKGKNRPLQSTLKMSTSGKICRRQKLAAYVSLVWPSRSLAKEYFWANRSEHLCCALQPSFLSHSTTRPLKCFMELTRRHHHSAIPQPHLVSPIQRNMKKTELSRPGYTAKTDCNLHNFEHTIAEVFFNTLEKNHGEKNLNVLTSFWKLEDLKLVVFWSTLYFFQITPKQISN